jgi:flagellar operon protein (TIGR03826 family)
MGDLRNCRRCGKLFVYTGIPLCIRCIEEDEEIFNQVKEYIENHPKCTTIEVAEALDVPAEKILQFLREGKLELDNSNTNMVLDCERCGRPIFTGRYCSECAVSMEKQFKKDLRMASTQSDREEGRMYTAYRRKKD